MPLARSADGAHLTAGQAARAEMHRRAPCAAGTVHGHAQLAQAVDQVCDGALPHARHPVQDKVPPACRRHGCREGPAHWRFDWQPTAGSLAACLAATWEHGHQRCQSTGRHPAQRSAP